MIERAPSDEDYIRHGHRRRREKRETKAAERAMAKTGMPKISSDKSGMKQSRHGAKAGRQITVSAFFNGLPLVVMPNGSLMTCAEWQEQGRAMLLPNTMATMTRGRAAGKGITMP